MRVRFMLLAAVGLMANQVVYADRLVLGSFSQRVLAEHHLTQLTEILPFELEIMAISLAQQGAVLTQLKGNKDSINTQAPAYRVVSANLNEAAYTQATHQAANANLPFWRLRLPGAAARSRPRAVQSTEINPGATAPMVDPKNPQSSTTKEPGKPVPNGVHQIQWDLGVQARAFSQPGTQGQNRLEGSFSVALDLFRSWRNNTRSVTFAPFVRVDSNDEERTHADIGEFYYSHIGLSHEVHLGAKKIFWGVTEFHHLIDVLNQTDLVENIDTEDKLGQPMIQWSQTGDWGTLDLFALVGFRERNFAGEEGRLRYPFPIAADATYASGADSKRIDGAIRWSRLFGSLELGVHHFSGTSREPILVPETTVTGDIRLRPHYPTIDQSGLDLQAFVGEWVFKFEGFSKSGYGQRYAAANVGLERTLYGVFDSKADLGLILEYLWDERGDEAFNTLYEHDVAIGARFQFNDYADSQALIGFIFDTEQDDYFLSIEASRRLSESWRLNLEARVFGGGSAWSPARSLPDITEPRYKSSWLQEDDYLQFELKKFL